MSILLSLMLAACADKADPPADTAEQSTTPADTAAPAPVDADGDGVTDDEDCDDTDATAYPGADEVCDEVDNDCDGSIDEDPLDGSDWIPDSDGDGYGDPYGTPQSACSQPTGYTDNTKDCDDTDASINPGADEYCDGIDTDCNGVEDDAHAVDAQMWYLDADDDGYASPLIGAVSCTAPSGYIAAPADGVYDCDDDDPKIGPC